MASQQQISLTKGMCHECGHHTVKQKFNFSWMLNLITIFIFELSGFASKSCTVCCVCLPNYAVFETAKHRQLLGSCQAVVMQLSCSCQAVVRQLPGSCQEVVRKLSGFKRFLKVWTEIFNSSCHVANAV